MAKTQDNSVVAAVTRQYREETKGTKYDEDFMLKQKFGLVTPQFTFSENNLLRREERNGRK